MHRWKALSLALLAASGAFAAEPPSPATSVTALPGITVQGKEDPLLRSDRHLSQIKKGLPTLGTDRAPQVNYVERAAAAYYDAHRDPNQLNVLEQETLLRLLGQDSLHSRPQLP